MSKGQKRIVIGTLIVIVLIFQWLTKNKGEPEYDDHQKTKPAEKKNETPNESSGIHSLPSKKIARKDSTQFNHSAADSKVSDFATKWSNTRPAINLEHVFHGEINRKGKPVGYHARPAGQDATDAKVVQVKDGPNRQGVYTATIKIRDGNQWKEKFSSFFPDSMSFEEVQDAILHAYKQSSNPQRQPWVGPSGHGFDIQGYTLSRGDINTAFPIYRRD